MMDLLILSDLHKEARGYRPTADYFAWFSSLTLERQNYEWRGLQREAKIREEQRADEQAHCYKTWVQDITYLMQMLKVDRPSAIKWSIESEDLDPSNPQDVEHYLFRQNLAFDKWGEIMRIFFPDYKEDWIM